MKVHFEFCYCCGSPCTGVLCDNCRSQLPRVEAAGCRICSRPLWGLDETCWACRDLDTKLDKIMAPFYYMGLAKALFQQYKFHHGWRLTRFWIENLRPFLEPGFVIVPIPPKKQNLIKRGWSPVEHLWQHLKTMQNPGLNLFKPISTEEQKRKDRSHRKTFCDIEISSLQSVPSKIILLDDTATTGATLNTYARVLRQYGAENVRGLVLTLAP